MANRRARTTLSSEVLATLDQAESLPTALHDVLDLIASMEQEDTGWRPLAEEVEERLTQHASRLRAKGNS